MMSKNYIKFLIAYTVLLLMILSSIALSAPIQIGDTVTIGMTATVDNVAAFDRLLATAPDHAINWGDDEIIITLGEGGDEQITDATPE